MRLRSFRRGIEYVVDDVKMSEPRRPSGHRFELRGVSHQLKHVAGSSERGVRRNVGSHARALQDGSGQVARAQADAATHVVDLPGLAVTNQRQVRLGRVADVEVVTNRIVADGKGGLGGSRLT